MSERHGDLRLLSEALRGRDPYHRLARLREQSPYSPSDGLVVVGRYEHCARILRHSQVSSGWERARINRRAEPVSRNFLTLDPPDHTRLRRLVTKAFTPRMVTRLEPLIQTETDELLEAAAGRGRFDVAADLASPMPMSVICGLLGVPVADHARLRAWAAPLAQQLDLPQLRPGGQRAAPGVARARADIIRYFRDLIEFRRDTPADDLISRLIAVQEDGDQLTESELISTCILLISAGHDTSANLIGNGVLALLEHPDQREQLAARPGYAAAYVEEVLRHDPPVQLVTRVVTADFDLDGFALAEGDLVLMLLGAANRDPDIFPQPEVFDPHRDHAARHLSFAAGPHFCLGAGLARLEAAIVLETLAKRLVDPRLEAHGVTYKPTFSLRGPERLPVFVQGLRERKTR
ncbi:cytochrome P450 [Amycolatopsis japonica]|uniref:cytochrome P450 n=1 Tax=Amycolatopsis japonica TaxID=208439 RepID=UPI0036720386